MLTSSDPDENTIYFEYDQLNRQTRIDYPDGDFSYYQYNAVSDLTLFEDPHGITYLEYNDLSRLSSEKQPGGAMTTYNYNGLGQTILMNNSVGQIKYTYDAAKRMTQIDNVTDFYGYGSQPWANTPYGGDVDSTTDSCYYEYNANDLMTKKTLGNGVFTYFSYDEANRVTQILNCAPDGSPLVYFSYDYDVASRITAIERENGTVVYYGYDDASRLTSENWYDSGMTKIYAFEWNYDLAGNRTFQKNGTVETTYTYDVSNALTQTVNNEAEPVYNTFAYDPRGNCISIHEFTTVETIGTTYFEYNHANLVTRITYKDGVENYFYYDGMLRRYAMQDSDGLRYFTWDRNGVNLLAERDEAGKVVAEYKHGYTPIQGIGSMVYGKKTVSEATYYQYPVFDHRGTVYKLTDENGNVTGDYEYNAWGDPLLDDDPVEGSWAHYQTDWINLKDSGGDLLISPARVYSAKFARFLQEDLLATVSMRGRLGVYQNSIFLKKSFILHQYQLGFLYNSFKQNPIVYVDSLGLTTTPTPRMSTFDTGIVENRYDRLRSRTTNEVYIQENSRWIRIGTIEIFVGFDASITDGGSSQQVYGEPRTNEDGDTVIPVGFYAIFGSEIEFRFSLLRHCIFESYGWRQFATGEAHIDGSLDDNFGTDGTFPAGLDGGELWYNNRPTAMNEGDTITLDDKPGYRFPIITHNRVISPGEETQNVPVTPHNVTNLDEFQNANFTVAEATGDRDQNLRRRRLGQRFRTLLIGIADGKEYILKVYLWESDLRINSIDNRVSGRAWLKGSGTFFHRF